MSCPAGAKSSWRSWASRIRGLILSRRSNAPMGLPAGSRKTFGRSEMPTVKSDTCRALSQTSANAGRPPPNWRKARSGIERCLKIFRWRWWSTTSSRRPPGLSSCVDPGSPILRPGSAPIRRNFSSARPGLSWWGPTRRPIGCWASLLIRPAWPRWNRSWAPMPMRCAARLASRCGRSARALMGR